MVLHRVVLGARAQNQPRRIRTVQTRDSTRHGCPRRARRARSHRARGKRQGLALAVGVVQVDKPRPVTRAAAQLRTGMPTAKGGLGVVEVKRLVGEAQLDRALQFLGHFGGVFDHRAHRVARIGRRKRAVHHVYAFNLFGRDHAPAGWKAQTTDAVAQIVAQQNAVGIHRRAGAVARARGAAGQNGVVVVAVVALAHQKAWEVLERIFAVGGVDVLLNLRGRDAFHRGRDLCRQRGGLLADNGDHAHFFARCVINLLGGEDKGVSHGHSQSDAVFTHENS